MTVRQSGFQSGTASPGWEKGGGGKEERGDRPTRSVSAAIDGGGNVSSGRRGLVDHIALFVVGERKERGKGGGGFSGVLRYHLLGSE